MHSVGEDSKVYLRHRSGPLEAWEQVTQLAAKVQDEVDVRTQHDNGAGKVSYRVKCKKR